MNFELKPLGEIINLKRGYDLPSQKRKQGLVPIISSSGITDFHSEPAKTGEGVVTGRYGTLGQLFYINGDYWPLNTTLYVQDFKGNVPKFIYYFLKTLSLEKFNAAAAVPGLDRNVLHKIDVNFISHLPTQRKIATVLSAYDDLIENNLKRIKLLEEKARIEYKTIQKNEKLELNKAVKVLQFTTGKLNSNAAVINGTYPFFTCGQEILRTNTFSFDEEVVLLGGNNASAIYPVFYYYGKFDAYQRTYIIKPKPEVYISFKYLYFYWESKLDHLRNISTGAATKFLTLKILNDMDIPLPETKVMKDYEKLTEPIFKLKAILSEQNAKLREARDILLPRLMSGEIEV